MSRQAGLLTAGQRESLEREGYLLVPSLLDESVVAPIRARLDEHPGFAPGGPLTGGRPGVWRRDHQLFARQDSIEETWRIVQPLLDQPPDIRPYLRGSWGPDDVEALIRGRPRWQPPWLPQMDEPARPRGS